MKRILLNAPFVVAGVFNFYDSLDVGAQSLLRPLYVLFAASVGFSLIVSREGKLSLRVVGGVVAISALGFLPVPFSNTSESVHVVGDIAVLIAVSYTHLTLPTKA